MVGMAGIEPTAACSQSMPSTGDLHPVKLVPRFGFEPKLVESESTVLTVGRSRRNVADTGVAPVSLGYEPSELLLF